MHSRHWPCGPTTSRRWARSRNSRWSGSLRTWSRSQHSRSEPLCVPAPQVLMTPLLPPAVPLIPSSVSPGLPQHCSLPVGFQGPPSSPRPPPVGPAFWHHLPFLGGNHSGERRGSACPANAGVLAFWGPLENLMKAMSLHPRNCLEPFSPTMCPERGPRPSGCVS